MPRVATSFRYAVIALLIALPSAARADTYIYDSQGRLIEVDYTAGGSVTYTYDAAGNRTQQVKTSP
ncbi:MAG: RHS repeat protein [Alphaproteobacteria bacterium]|nr:RHS repeat protein [Alphaproteobacteria bacterium]